MANSFQTSLRLSHHSEHFWKRKLFLICKNPSYTLLKKLKILIDANRCKSWRIKSPPRTKTWFVSKPKVAPDRIFAPRLMWLWEKMWPNWKTYSLSIVLYSKNHLPRRHSFEEPENFSAYRPPLSNEIGHPSRTIQTSKTWKNVPIKPCFGH